MAGPTEMASLAVVSGTRPALWNGVLAASSNLRPMLYRHNSTAVALWGYELLGLPKLFR